MAEPVKQISLSVQDHEKTKTSICTFLSVLVHFNIIIPKVKDEVKGEVDSWLVPQLLSHCFFFSNKMLTFLFVKVAQLRKALDVILQWCFNHNFSVRLYALLALKRVWSLAEAQASEGADGFSGLSTVVKACLNQAEAMQSTGWGQNNCEMLKFKTYLYQILKIICFLPQKCQQELDQDPGALLLWCLWSYQGLQCGGWCQNTDKASSRSAALMQFLFSSTDHLSHFPKSVRGGWRRVASALQVSEADMFLWESVTSFEKPQPWPEAAAAWGLDPARQRYSSTYTGT